MRRDFLPVRVGTFNSGTVVVVCSSRQGTTHEGVDGGDTGVLAFSGAAWCDGKAAQRFRLSTYPCGSMCIWREHARRSSFVLQAAVDLDGLMRRFMQSTGLTVGSVDWEGDVSLGRAPHLVALVACNGHHLAFELSAMPQ